MTHFPITLTAALLLVLSTAALPTASAFQNPADDGADLGPALPELPPLPDPSLSGKPSAAENVPGSPDREFSAADHAAAAEQLIEEGRIDIAIEAASLAIAADPENLSYRKIRAKAYQLTGRYEQALADSKPLEVVVAAREANLKSANDVVAIVPQGAVLNVSEVRGDWLKVESLGDQQFKWAWISRRNLAQAPPRRAPAQIIIQPISPADYYGRIYGGGYYDLGRRSGYGRAYYDWTRHVPGRYWGFLPW